MDQIRRLLARNLMSACINLASTNPAPNKTFIEAPQNVRNLRYLLLPIDETNGISAILGS